MSEHRPDPEALLARVKEEEARARRGKLKMFFGAAAGVGKTYAMLEAARELRADGVDVVVGIVETHKRAETEALLDGLEILPRRAVEYRGTTLHEFDLDAALLRAPPSSWWTSWPTPTRPAPATPSAGRTSSSCSTPGIDVYTTVNVQHVESLNDVVAKITGVVDARDGAGLGLRAGRRGRADRPAARRPAAALPRGQGLRPRPGPGGAGELLPQGQPDRAARAVAAAHRRARRRADARLPARARHRPGVADRRAHPGLHRARAPSPRGWCGRPSGWPTVWARSGSPPTSRPRPSCGCRRRPRTASSRRCGWPSSSAPRRSR